MSDHSDHEVAAQLATEAGQLLLAVREELADASEADRWEKLRQVEGRNHGLAGMGLRASEAGTARDKTVGVIMHRDGG